MALPDLDHVRYLRLAFAVAERAAAAGSHPFGAILVDGGGAVLLEQGNAYWPDHDMTGHAERVLATRASARYRPPELVNATMYTSAEPCAMCAGAAYWAGIGRVVSGLSEQRKGDHRRPSGKSDARSSLPRRLCQWPTPRRGDRAPARRRGDGEPRDLLGLALSRL